MVALALVVLAATQVKPLPTAAWFGADSPELRYVGRIGHERPDAATFYYSASEFVTKFSGRSLALKFAEDVYGPANSFGVRIDGGPEIPLQLVANSDQAYVVAVGLAPKWHSLEVYRRQDTYGGVAIFRGLWLDTGAKLASAGPAPRRKLEFFGDSVLGGTASEAFGYEARQDGEVGYFNGDAFLNNGYWSFGALTARRLGAEANVEGIGGLALLDHTGWFGGDLSHTVGLVSTWDKLDPLPGQYSDWDFGRFTPDAVVISVGQNDARGGKLADVTWLANWKATYVSILDKLRAHYPNAQFILTTTVLMHERGWDAALKEVAAEYAASRSFAGIRYFGFKRAGLGTPGHPRLAEEEEMAAELSAFLRHLPGLWGH